MKIILHTLTGFVALWGIAALTGFALGLAGIIQNGFPGLFETAGILLGMLCVGLFAGISLYSAFSFWTRWNKRTAEHILSLSAFYVWVTFMMIFSIGDWLSASGKTGEPFDLEAFIGLASIPVMFLIYRSVQERMRHFFSTSETEAHEARSDGDTSRR